MYDENNAWYNVENDNIFAAKVNNSSDNVITIKILTI